MINEGIIRSPKWLRNFLDFEINTGKDIKGEPSKKAKANQEKADKKVKDDQEKAKQRAELKKWDDAWEKLYNVREFREFLNTLVGDPTYYNITSYQMDAFRKTFRGDMSIFEDFSKYYDNKNEENKKSAELERKLRSLIKRLITDSISAPYDDKITSYHNAKREFCIKYKFENNDIVDIFDINGKRFKFSDNDYIHTYTLTTELWNLLVQAINAAQNRARTRPSSRSNANDRHYGYSGGSKSSDSGKSSASSKNTSNPKWSKYKSILDTIDLRKSQLAKMPKSSPDRPALENELKAAERMAKRMKDEYKFENLKGFNDFDSFNS